MLSDRDHISIGVVMAIVVCLVAWAILFIAALLGKF